MGNFYNIFSNVSPTEFYESSDMKKEFIAYPKLNVHPNFNFENENYSSDKAIELFEQAKKENFLQQKISLLHEALNYNNSNSDIIFELLKLETEQNKKNDILRKYGYYLSEYNYKLYFNKDKKSSIELMKELFCILEKYDKKNILNSVENIWNFVEEYSLIKIKNTFINEYNKEEELLVYFLLLTKQIIILIYSKKYIVYFDDKLSYDDKLKKYFTESEQDYIKILIDSYEKNPNTNKDDLEKIKKDLMYNNFKCFNFNFPFIGELIKELKEEITFCLDNLNDSNFYIIACFNELINNLLFDYNNEKNEKLIRKIKKVNKNLILNKNDIINKFNSRSKTFILKEDKDNSNNLILINENGYNFLDEKNNSKTLENAFIYDWEEIIENASRLFINFGIPLEYQLLNYIRIEDMNEYNFIKYSIGFIEELTTKISKSNTIISLLNYLYPGCEIIFNEKSSFLPNLIKKILNFSYCFNLYSYKAANSYNPIKKIYFFLFNRFNKNLYSEQDFIYYLVANLGVFIYIFHHEFFGHYILHYLNLLTRNKYSSPFSIIEKGEESGKFIESKLFGKRMQNLSLSQLLYILDIDNYKYDFNNFSLNFQKSENFFISQNLSDMFEKHFGFKLNLKGNEAFDPITLFGHNILSNENITITDSSFNNCVPLKHIDIIYNLEKIQKMKNNI